MGIVWGLATSLTIGLADLFARRIVNARGALVAGVSMQAIAIVTSLAAVLVVSSRFDGGDLGIGLASGFGMGVGMWGYLGGLQRSTATLVAPIVATMSAVIPYTYALVRGASPTAFGVVGAVVAIGGLVIVTISDPSPTTAFGTEAETQSSVRRDGVRWAVFSGCGYGFGLSVILDADAASGSWPAVGQRITAFALIVVACRAAGHDVLPPIGLRLAAVGAGVLTGLSTVFYLLGVEADPTAAVVTASLFPAISVLVGRLAYGDAVNLRQVGGICVVLIGVIGVATG